MYVLPSGYFILQKTEESTLELQPQFSPHSVIKPISVLNTGGTITSVPHPQYGGVRALRHALHPATRIGRIIAEEGLGCAEVRPKNSEHYDWADYTAVLDWLRQRILQGHKDWIVLHGTDNAAFFAVLLAILAKETGGRLVLTFCQRSMDRPTWQGGMLIRAAHALIPRMRRATCLVVSYHDSDRVALHSPLNLKKIHTTRKLCMESAGMQSWVPGSELPRLHPYRIPPLVSLKNRPPGRGIELLTPLCKPSLPYVVGYGVGNCPLGLQSRMIGTRIGAGPYNGLLYGGSWSPESDYSLEARYLFQELKP